MPELVAINILIGDRNYRIKIDPKDEETVRRAVKTIQDKIIEFKGQFAGKDMQDYIAMVVIWFATDRSEGAPAAQIPPDLLARLVSIENALDSAIK